nr:MAG: protease [unidentified adenovirus]
MGTNESELKQIVQDLGLGSLFLGTFDKTFPGFIEKHKPCCAIVNTGLRSTGGVHWIAMAWEPKSYFFYLFDPFGFDDKQLLRFYNFRYQHMLKASAITSTPTRCVTLIRNYEAIQGPYSGACGLFCCLFLRAFLKYPFKPMNNPILDPLSGVAINGLFKPTNLSIFVKNQKYLNAYLEKHSRYFRRHKKEIEVRTAVNVLL